MKSEPDALLMVENDAHGDVLTCAEGLSFWGGVDPDTGFIIDAHHPDCGACLSGRVVLMPTSRGSCSGSGVLLQLALNGRAPAALVFREDEEILTLGAIIAHQLFRSPVAVLRLSWELYAQLSDAQHVSITNDSLRFGSTKIALSTPQADHLSLTETEQHLLDGHDGPAAQVAMEVLCRMARIQGAQELIDVSRAHIDGCILAHDANLHFAEKMDQMGARVRIPTTINAISVDRENWGKQDVVPDFGTKASRLADAYVHMGAQPTFTCAPYLLDDTPAEGEAIGWSESNAVIYANSVLGARTQKHPDYLDLFIAMTGRAPKTGVYLKTNRIPASEVRVTLPQHYDESIWPMLGWFAGTHSPDAVPVLTGLEDASLAPDDLKALCAAFGTTSAAPMLHVRGHTPEDTLSLRPDAPHFGCKISDLAQVWQTLNTGPATVDLVAIGSPHASLSECRNFADLLAGQVCHPEVNVIVTVGRGVLRIATSEGIIDTLTRSGVQVIPDICWCSITEPLFPPSANTVMTNSAKYAHYATGLTGRTVRFGSLQDCALTALSGQTATDLPDWLTES